MTGSEHVLIEDWCQQYPSHSVGTVDFGPDGALYASAGDGASFNFTDYGQDGSPVNPCGDPPGGVGGPMTPPSAEGGALRSQDIRTSSDAATLDGSIIRVDPATGAALASNPLVGDPDPNVRRIVAHGLRNPFRFTFRPGTSELWLGDVGWSTDEEVDRILDPTDTRRRELRLALLRGRRRNRAATTAQTSPSARTCTWLRPRTRSRTSPITTRTRSSRARACPTGSSSISGLAFNAGFPSTFPSQYEGALFFSDYSRDCIWAMKTGGGSTPSPAHLETFVFSRRQPREPPVRPGRRPLRPRLRRGHDSTDPLRRHDGSGSHQHDPGQRRHRSRARCLADRASSPSRSTRRRSRRARSRSTKQGVGTPLVAIVSYDDASRICHRSIRRAARTQRHLRRHRRGRRSRRHGSGAAMPLASDVRLDVPDE